MDNYVPAIYLEDDQQQANIVEHWRKPQSRSQSLYIQSLDRHLKLYTDNFDSSDVPNVLDFDQQTSNSVLTDFSNSVDWSNPTNSSPDSV